MRGDPKKEVLKEEGPSRIYPFLYPTTSHRNGNLPSMDNDFLASFDVADDFAEARPESKEARKRRAFEESKVSYQNERVFLEPEVSLLSSPTYKRSTEISEYHSGLLWARTN